MSASTHRPCAGRPPTAARSLLAGSPAAPSPPPRWPSSPIAVWPASEADKARADGERFGEAVGELHTRTTRGRGRRRARRGRTTAASDTADHAGDEVAEQVDEQADALARAADGFVGAHDGRRRVRAGPLPGRARRRRRRPQRQAEDFRAEGPEVQQAFWDGYQDGLAGT